MNATLKTRASASEITLSVVFILGVVGLAVAALAALAGSYELLTLTKGGFLIQELMEIGVLTPAFTELCWQIAKLGTSVSFIAVPIGSLIVPIQ